MFRLALMLSVAVALCSPAVSGAQDPLPRPGAGLPTFEAPLEAPTDVRGKTDALLDKVSPEQRGVLTTQVVTREATVESIDLNPTEGLTLSFAATITLYTSDVSSGPGSEPGPTESGAVPGA